MADFLVSNLVGSDEFIELAKKKAGGIRVAAAFAIGGQTALEQYIKNVVTSQLSLISENPAIDEEEADIISDVVGACPDQVETVQTCYGGDKEALMTCVNCVWAELLAAEGGTDCDGIGAKVDESVATCTGAGSCNTDCADVEANLHSCAVTERCGDEGLVLQIA